MTGLDLSVCRLAPRALLVALALLASVAPAQDAPSAVGPLLKLYRSGKLPAERQPAVVEMICTRGNEHDLRVVLDKLLEPERMPAAVRLKALSGLADAAATRKVKPAGDLDGIARLIDAEDPAVRLAAVKLAAACHVAAAGPALRKIALDSDSSVELERAALNGLVALGGDDSRSTLLTLVKEAPTTATRLAAAAGLVNFDARLAAAQAAGVLETATPQDDPGPLLDAFLNRKDGPLELARALETTKLPVDVAKRALRTMFSVGRSDPELAGVLSHAAGISLDAPPPTPEEVAQIVREVSEKGNAQRGEKIFRRADISCMRCHSVSRAGGQVGPELSALGGSSPIDYVANSILNPNLAVKEQYVTRVFELMDGKVYSGVVIDRDETRVRIRDAQGKVLIIPTADVEEESEGISMMPLGLTKFLTRDELLDLIRFVSELGKPGDYAVQTIPRIQRWQMLTSPPAELINEVPHLDHIRQFVLGSDPAVWSSVYAQVAGLLPLEELRRPTGGQVVILRGELQVNEPGEVAFHLECTEKVQAWVDAQPVPPQERFTVPLEAGRHFLILRVEISETSSPGLRVELSRPEGSTAQFEVVGGM